MIDIASGIGWLGMAPGNKTTVVFQTGLTGSTGSIHRKGREERKAEEQKSLRLIEFHVIPTAQGNKEMVVFQTGSTGCVISFNQVLPVIMEANS